MREVLRMDPRASGPDEVSVNFVDMSSRSADVESIRIDFRVRPAGLFDFQSIPFPNISLFFSTFVGPWGLGALSCSIVVLRFSMVIVGCGPVSHVFFL